MTEHDNVRWLHRRAGFGLPIDQLRSAEARGAEAELQQLVAADPATLADPWDDARLPIEPNNRDAARHAVQAWAEAMLSTTTPLVDRVAWMWHGHFVSALDKVRIARLMVEQVRLFRRDGLGPFRNLMRSVTIDPAMLLYLDLRTSTGEQPNENYARELLELFTLGEGNYSEADVQAAAAALTGWTLERQGGVQFRPFRHDDTAQRFLGVEGVHDLDTVVDAVMADSSMPKWIAATVVAEFLGAVGSQDLIDGLAKEFTDSGFDCGALVEATLRQGLAGESAPVVLAPVPWFVIASRVTGATPDGRAAPLLRAAGQLPMLPPNVAGWPGGAAWFSASSLVARANLAAVLASAVPEGEVLEAARSRDHDALADVLGLSSRGFSKESVAALTQSTPGPARLAVALVTPEFVIA